MESRICAASLKIHVAESKLHIAGDYLTAAIYNIAGMDIRIWEGSQSIVELSGIAKGIYIVKVISASGKPEIAKITVK